MGKARSDAGSPSSARQVGFGFCISLGARRLVGESAHATRAGECRRERAPAQTLQTHRDRSRQGHPPHEPARCDGALQPQSYCWRSRWPGLQPKTVYFWRNPLANAKFTRLLDFAGTEQAAAISRDGKLVAFLADRDGQIDAWVSEVRQRHLPQFDAWRLKLSWPLSILRFVRSAFSADSSLVTIWTRRADGSQTGDVNILAVPTAGGPLRPYLREAGEFDWSHDGSEARLPHDRTRRSVVRAGVRQVRGDRRIYVAPAGVHCHFPLWSPDDAFIYFVRGVPPDDWDIWRIRPSGAGLERITTQNARVTYPVMLDRRTLLYLATDADGSGPWMYSVDVERRLSHRISSGLESYTSLAASADGARLVATIANARTSVWRMSLTEDRDAATAAASPLARFRERCHTRLGADFLLYVSWQGDRQGIWSLAHGTTREIWSSAHSRIVGEPCHCSRWATHRLLG